VLPGGINRYNKQYMDRMADRIWFRARTEKKKQSVEVVKR